MTVYGRAKAELDELLDRLEKLEVFLSTGKYEKLALVCKALLATQRDAMRIYARVLQERIELYLTDE